MASVCWSEFGFWNDKLLTFHSALFVYYVGFSATFRTIWQLFDLETTREKLEHSVYDASM